MMDEILLGLGSHGEKQMLRLGRANRHSLIVGATFSRSVLSSLGGSQR